MTKNFLHFLGSRSELDADQIREELLTMADNMAHTPLSHYRLVPLTPSFDDTAQRESPEGRPEGYQLFTKTMEALEESYPLRAAVLQMQTLLRILLVGCEENSLHKLSQEDYKLMLNLLHDLYELTLQCAKCPLSSPISDS